MTHPTHHDKRWWALLALAFAQFITIMDTSIIGVALPDIQQALGFSPEGLSWVFNAYVIASAACCSSAADSATCSARVASLLRGSSF